MSVFALCVDVVLAQLHQLATADPRSVPRMKCLSADCGYAAHTTGHAHHPTKGAVAFVGGVAGGAKTKTTSRMALAASKLHM